MTGFAQQRLSLRTNAAATFADEGYAIVPVFVGADLVAALLQRTLDLDRAGELQPAGVGRASDRVIDREVRGDSICWIDTATSSDVERSLLDAFEQLRVAINRTSLLGLFEFEAHYARYAPGTGYTRHRDRFRDDDARVVSCVLYLNADWRDADGGALRLHVDDARSVDVLPCAGTLVVFQSERFEHEVLPATRSRCSIAGWFRRRT